MKINIFKKQVDQTPAIKKAVAEIISTNEVGFNAVKNNHTLNFNRIWNNLDFTPQEILDEFGESAKDLFLASALTQQYIKTIDPTYQVLVPPNEFTINEDGTVTVGEPIVISE